MLSGAIAPTALRDLLIAAQAVVVLALTACEVRGALRLAPGVDASPVMSTFGEPWRAYAAGLHPIQRLKAR